MRLSTTMRFVRGKLPCYGYEQQPDPRNPDWQRCFCFYFWLVGWDCIQLGFHVALLCPNIELHIPFGFVRIGWLKRRP